MGLFDKNRGAAIRASAGANIGRSVGAGRPIEPRAADPKLEGIRATDSRFRMIAIGRLEPDPGQPRRDGNEGFTEESLRSLGEDMAGRCQDVPIIAYWHEPSGMYRIQDGERRYRAARLVGLAELECKVFDKPLEPTELRIAQYKVNRERSALSPVEEARFFRERLDELGCSQAELARRLGIRYPAEITRSLALLDVDPEIRAYVQDGALSATHAYEISRLPRDEQSEIAHRAISQNLTARQVGDEVKARAGRAAGQGVTAAETPPVGPTPADLPETTLRGATAAGKAGQAATVAKGPRIVQDATTAEDGALRGATPAGPPGGKPGAFQVAPGISIVKPDLAPPPAESDDVAIGGAGDPHFRPTSPGQPSKHETIRAGVCSIELHPSGRPLSIHVPGARVVVNTFPAGGASMQIGDSVRAALVHALQAIDIVRHRVEAEGEGNG